MAIYVDSLFKTNHPKFPLACHLITDSLDLEELHQFATRIGLKRVWFQNTNHPHYDLTENKRRVAVKHGAIETTTMHLIEIQRARKHPVRCMDCMRLPSELEPGNTIGYSGYHKAWLCTECAMHRGT